MLTVTLVRNECSWWPCCFWIGKWKASLCDVIEGAGTSPSQLLITYFFDFFNQAVNRGLNMQGFFLIFYRFERFKVLRWHRRKTVKIFQDNIINADVTHDFLVSARIERELRCHSSVFWPELCRSAGILVFFISTSSPLHLPPPLPLPLHFSCDSSPVWNLLQPGRKSRAHFCSDKSFWWKWKWFQCVTGSPSEETGWKTEMIVCDNGAAFSFSTFSFSLRPFYKR